MTCRINAYCGSCASFAADRPSSLPPAPLFAGLLGTSSASPAAMADTGSVGCAACCSIGLSVLPSLEDAALCTLPARTFVVPEMAFSGPVTVLAMPLTSSSRSYIVAQESLGSASRQICRTFQNVREDWHRKPAGAPGIFST